MTQALALKNILKKDQNGDRYCIPERMKNEFIRLDEDVQNTESGSKDWFAAQSEFDSVFLQYQI